MLLSPYYLWEFPDRADSLEASSKLLEAMANKADQEWKDINIKFEELGPVVDDLMSKINFTTYLSAGEVNHTKTVTINELSNVTFKNRKSRFNDDIFYNITYPDGKQKTHQTSFTLDANSKKWKNGDVITYIVQAYTSNEVAAPEEYSFKVIPGFSLSANVTAEYSPTENVCRVRYTGHLDLTTKEINLYDDSLAEVTEVDGGWDIVPTTFEIVNFLVIIKDKYDKVLFPNSFVQKFGLLYKETKYLTIGSFGMNKVNNDYRLPIFDGGEVGLITFNKEFTNSGYKKVIFPKEIDFLTDSFVDTARDKFKETDIIKTLNYEGVDYILVYSPEDLTIHLGYYDNITSTFKYVIVDFYAVGKPLGFQISSQDVVFKIMNNEIYFSLGGLNHLYVWKFNLSLSKSTRLHSKLNTKNYHHVIKKMELLIENDFLYVSYVSERYDYTTNKGGGMFKIPADYKVSLQNKTTLNHFTWNYYYYGGGWSFRDMVFNKGNVYLWSYNKGYGYINKSILNTHNNTLTETKAEEYNFDKKYGDITYSRILNGDLYKNNRFFKGNSEIIKTFILKMDDYNNNFKWFIFIARYDEDMVFKSGYVFDYDEEPVDDINAVFDGEFWNIRLTPNSFVKFNGGNTFTARLGDTNIRPFSIRNYDRDNKIKFRNGSYNYDIKYENYIIKTTTTKPKDLDAVLEGRTPPFSITDKYLQPTGD